MKKLKGTLRLQNTYLLPNKKSENKKNENKKLQAKIKLNSISTCLRILHTNCKYRFKLNKVLLTLLLSSIVFLSFVLYYNDLPKLFSQERPVAKSHMATKEYKHAHGMRDCILSLQNHLHALPLRNPFFVTALPHPEKEPLKDVDKKEDTNMPVAEKKPVYRLCGIIRGERPTAVLRIGDDCVEGQVGSLIGHRKITDIYARSIRFDDGTVLTMD